MKKRGISPLIATVLIIGFTIVVGSLILIWGGELLEKIKGETEEKTLIKLTCATKINFDIKIACDTRANSIIVLIDNRGDININSLIARVTGSGIGGEKTITEKIGEAIDSYGARRVSIPSYTIINPTKVDIFPRVLIEDKEQTCDSRSKEIIPCKDVNLPDVNEKEDWSPIDLIKVSEITVLPEELKTQLNLNGYGLTGSGSLTMESKQFVIPNEYTGIKLGSWAGPGIYTYKLVDSNGNIINQISDSYTTIMYSTFILKGSGEVKLVATGTDLITVSEIYLYEEPKT